MRQRRIKRQDKDKDKDSFLANCRWNLTYWHGSDQLHFKETWHETKTNTKTAVYRAARRAWPTDPVQSNCAQSDSYYFLFHRKEYYVSKTMGWSLELGNWFMWKPARFITSAPEPWLHNDQLHTGAGSALLLPWGDYYYYYYYYCCCCYFYTAAAVLPLRRLLLVLLLLLLLQYYWYYYYYCFHSIYMRRVEPPWSWFSACEHWWLTHVEGSALNWKELKSMG